MNVIKNKPTFLKFLKNNLNNRPEKYNKKRLQSGRSMIEMLGVLAIVGVLSAGGIAGYSMAMQIYKTNQLIDKIQLIATQTRKLYKGNYSEPAIWSDLLRSGYIKDREHPFGGLLHIAGEGDYFHIHNMGDPIPSEACVDVLTTDYGGPGVFVGIRVRRGGTGYRDFYWSDGTYPPSMEQAISACNFEGGVYLTWIFK